MGSVAASRTNSGPAPHCSSYFSNFYCPPTQNFRENILLGNKPFSATITLYLWLHSGKNTQFYLGITYKDIYPFWLETHLHTKIVEKTVWATSRPISHMVVNSNGSYMMVHPFFLSEKAIVSKAQYSKI